jgi:hypothetical protein
MQLSSDRRRNLAPLLFVCGTAIGAVPILHPLNTCRDWLEKWGQQSMHHGWVAMHQLGMAGFAAVALAGVFLALMGKQSVLSLFGGAGFCSGFLIHANTTISHATQVSWLARAWIASKNPETRAILRTTAESLLMYDDAAWKLASFLSAGGGVLLMIALWREKVISPAVAAVTIICALVWTAQPLGIIRWIFHTQLTEISYWLFLTVWFFVLGAALLIERNRPIATD